MFTFLDLETVKLSIPNLAVLLLLLRGRLQHKVAGRCSHYSGQRELRSTPRTDIKNIAERGGDKQCVVRLVVGKTGQENT